MWCAGQPPLFRRGDEATTPSETVAARVHNIDEVIKEEGLRLCMYPGVDGCPEPITPAATRPPLVLLGSATRLSCTARSYATVDERNDGKDVAREGDDCFGGRKGES